MNTAPWPQEIVLKPMEDILTSTNSNTSAGYNNTTSLPNHNTTATTTAKPPSSQPSTPSERKVRPQKDEALNCPRCNSTNTKFCYYNNYSLAQPRYFCKTCRRYWTAGGSLRNIPVGGGSRKNKRSSPSSIITSAGVSKIKLPDLIVAPPNSSSNTNPNNSSNTTPHGKINIFHHHEGQDLNLGFPSTLSEFMNLPNIENTTDKNSSHMSALELLTGLTSSASRAPFNSFMMPIQQQMSSSDHDPYPTTGFSLQGTVSNHHFKPTTLGFSLGNEGGYGMQSGNGRMLFPFQDLNSTEEASARISNTSTTTATAASSGHQQNYSHDDAANGQQIVKDLHHQGTGYWSGMLGGAGSW